MSQENKSIIEFDYNLICEYFSNIERQGPGSKEATLKALGFIDNLDGDAKIADIGCGAGGQTITLAQNALGKITAVDLFPQFIKALENKANELNLKDRITGIAASMENLPFEENEFDVLWSEGAIYNIGFENGLNLWRKFLKQGGYIAVSEASWFTNARPKEIEEFWNAVYPEIDTIPKKLQQMQNAGYIPIAAFILPENCWIDNFYEPQTKAQEIFLSKYPNNQMAQELVENEKREFELYKKYKEYYGYAFYIGKKV